VAVSLRRKGVSQGAALAFWLGNPTLNPAVLVFITLTLGWGWTLLRLGLGLALVLGVPLLATTAAGSRGRPAPTAPPAPAARSARPETDPVEPPEATEAALAEERAPWAVRWLKSLGKLSLGLIPEYVVVMLALGAARAWLFPAVGAETGNSLPVIVGLAVAGALFAIPTAGEVPIIQTMRAFGLGAGPAGALLLTLAPVSLPSLLMIGRAFPRRSLALVAAATIALGTLAGLLAIALGL
jgi:uncharacterized membrane protein YraQ (UPF0718 family)